MRSDPLDTLSRQVQRLLAADNEERHARRPRPLGAITRTITASRRAKQADESNVAEFSAEPASRR